MNEPTCLDIQHPCDIQEANLPLLLEPPCHNPNPGSVAQGCRPAMGAISRRRHGFISGHKGCIGVVDVIQVGGFTDVEDQGVGYLSIDKSIVVFLHSVRNLQFVRTE